MHVPTPGCCAQGIPPLKPVIYQPPLHQLSFNAVALNVLNHNKAGGRDTK